MPSPAENEVAAPEVDVSRSDLRLFALASSRALGQVVALACGSTLSRHEERPFEDGEYKVRSLESVRGADVYVLHSLHDDASESVHDKFCRLLFLLGAVRDAGAARVTAVTPYLCYARKDRRTQPRDPVTTRYIAVLFEAMGVDAVVALDVHNPAAFENAFRCRTEHLEARPVLVKHVLQRLGGCTPVVVSPDVGGVKRAQRFRDTLAASLGQAVETAFVEKRRSGGVVTGDRLAGDVTGSVVVLVDDMVSTGTTLVRAAESCRAAGALRVIALATHGLFLDDAPKALAASAIDELVVTDSVPPFRLEDSPAAAKLTVVSVAPLLGEVIRRLHSDGSIVELFS
jgi:ribose-phosphate pyrophosphokinase